MQAPTQEKARAFVGWAEYLAAADPPDEPAGSRRRSSRTVNADSWEKDPEAAAAAALDELGPVQPAEFFDFGDEEPAYESDEARAERAVRDLV